MTDLDLIESGDLEAYVCGVLSHEESKEISSRIRGNKTLRNEVEHIESCYIKLAQGVAPQSDEHLIFDRLLEAINISKTTDSDRTSFNFNYISWAAAIVFLIATGYLYISLNESTRLNDGLQQQISQQEQKNEFLNSEVIDAVALNANYEDALTFIKNKNTTKVFLGGQKGFENSEAVAFHNPVEQVTYLDIKGLPNAPADKSYQLWSLTLNPLTPSSLGVLDNSMVMLTINNPFETQAFGITLEPKGGSPSPNLEQLYTLGVIE
jgi:anti-sigma-K factor RskA